MDTPLTIATKAIAETPDKPPHFVASEVLLRLRVGGWMLPGRYDYAPITVAFIHYHHPHHKEQVHWTKMPAVPCEGDTVHVPLAPLSANDSIALRVKSVAWTDDHSCPEDGALPGWHAEVHLG
jgi:hypothetical protein